MATKEPFTQQATGPGGSPATETVEPHAGGLKPAEPIKRGIALVIDAVIAVAVGMVPVLGGLAATGYWLVRDGLDVDFMPHRSLGKKLMGLRPVTLDGHPVDLATSAMRNWPLALGGIVQILLFIPFVGWLLMLPVALIALAIGVIEVVLVFVDGRRIGDRTGGTRVVEG